MLGGAGEELDEPSLAPGGVVGLPGLFEAALRQKRNDAGEEILVHLSRMRHEFAHDNGFLFGHLGEDYVYDGLFAGANYSFQHKHLSLGGSWVRIHVLARASEPVFDLRGLRAPAAHISQHIKVKVRIGDLLGA